MNEKIIIILFSAAVCIAAADISDAFYQWVDENGVVRFSDSAPADLNDVEQHKDVKSAPAPSKTLNTDSQTTQPSATNVLKAPDDAKEILGTYALGPYEKEEVSYDAKETTRIGFTTDVPIEKFDDCKNYGAGIIDKHSETFVKSVFGGSIDLNPKQGQIDFYVENMEDFPIQVIVYIE